MQQIAQILSKDLKSAVEEIFGVTENLDWSFQETRKEFDGEITLVTFPLTKALKSKPEEIGNKLGQRLKEESHLVADFNVVKGFLNLVLQDEYWLEQFNQAVSQDNYGHGSSGPKRHVMVEFSSPNTNKPLHLGHLRNIFLGHSVSRILEANGHAVKKVQIINDRGIHICKSMLAWQMFGNGETPANAKLKGDKFVGKYYVLFDVKYKEEQKRIQQELLTTDVSALKEASTWKKAVKGDEEWQLISKAKQEGIDALDERASAKFKAITDRLNKYLVGAQEMLRKWEQEDEKVRALWETMNGWVYDGFNATYREMGVEFDKLYYESNTYLKGRDVVMEGLEKNVFYQREDKSIWVDLTQDGLDEKLLLRSDGTAVYMTQDIGTAIQRYEDLPELNQIVYTVGNEQDYHFQVLFKILDKMGYSWAKNCYHLSYGMVDLPTGKMKSREGTVVDADDLISEMVEEAQRISEELGKIKPDEEAFSQLNRTVGLGALKYHLLKVDPKKRMLFDPKESIDFAGHTGPFIQYTYARIQSLLNKKEVDFKEVNTDISLQSEEKQLLVLLGKYPSAVKQAGDEFNPAVLANYLYELVKAYNVFYQNITVLKEENNILLNFRMALSKKVGQVIKSGMYLLGIEVPARM